MGTRYVCARGKVPINLTIAEDGDELGGTWVGPQVSNALSEGSVGGTRLGQQLLTP